jgi:hypothetical protein
MFYKNVDSEATNKMFLDSYKTNLLNIAGRLKSNPTSIPIKVGSMIDESISSYVIMNVRDVLLTLGNSFISDIFNYDKADSSKFMLMDSRNIPYDLIFSNTVENQYDVITELYTFVFPDDSSFTDLISTKPESGSSYDSYTIQVKIGESFDKLYSILIEKFFDKMVHKLAREICAVDGRMDYFYATFIAPFDNTNKDKSYALMRFEITNRLRELILPYIEIFKDKMYEISNTTASMVLGLDFYNYEIRYDDFLKSNPFVYEILMEKYGTKSEEEGESNYEEE